MELIVEVDHETLSRKAAEMFFNTASSCVRENGKFSAALSGGSTPRRFYEILGEEPLRSGIPWSGVHLFWGDERCVPPDDAASNYRLVADSLLSRIEIPVKNIHRLKGEIEPEEAALEYEEELRRFFGSEVSFPAFDYILLGIGPDGHTASLFPGTKALEEKDRCVVSNFVPKFNMKRLTFTFPLINAARNIAFLVSGAEKSDILAKIINGGSDGDSFPAVKIQPRNGKLFWLLDQEAARKL